MLQRFSFPTELTGNAYPFGEPAWLLCRREYGD